MKLRPLNVSLIGKACIFLQEPVACGVVQPRVVVGAADAGVQVDGLAGELLGGQLAPVGGHADGAALGGALFLPGGEVLGTVDRHGVLDPLDDLGHGDEVHLGVVLEHLVDPVEEGVEELGVVLEPGCVEEESEGGRGSGRNGGRSCG